MKACIQSQHLESLCSAAPYLLQHVQLTSGFSLGLEAPEQPGVCLNACFTQGQDLSMGPLKDYWIFIPSWPSNLIPHSCTLSLTLCHRPESLALGKKRRPHGPSSHSLSYLWVRPHFHGNVPGSLCTAGQETSFSGGFPSWKFIMFTWQSVTFGVF